MNVLDGKVAVVTGASKNIGLGIARALAEAGATVVMVARTASLLEAKASEIRDETWPDPPRLVHVI